MTDETTEVAHDAERATRHGLAHLEEEFIAECKKAALFTEEKAKELLQWLASKV